jgi:hypothetical protein
MVESGMVAAFDLEARRCGVGVTRGGALRWVAG